MILINSSYSSLTFSNNKSKYFQVYGDDNEGCFFARHISSQILFSSSTAIYTWFINLQNDAWQILREVERKFMFYSEKRTGIGGIRKTNKNFPWRIFLLCCLSLCRIKIEKESKEIRIENWIAFTLYGNKLSKQPKTCAQSSIIRSYFTFIVIVYQYFSSRLLLLII